MSDGFQVIEPMRLAALMTNPNQREFAVAVLDWLAQEISAELKERMEGIDISVICVEYMGAYPALGVKYREGSQELGRLIEETADRLLRERTVEAFVDFISRGRKDWKATSREIMSK